MDPVLAQPNPDRSPGSPAAAPDEARSLETLSLSASKSAVKVAQTQPQLPQCAAQGTETPKLRSQIAECGTKQPRSEALRKPPQEETLMSRQDIPETAPLEGLKEL